VLGGLVPETLDVCGLAGQEGGGGVDHLATPLQQLGDRVLGQPVHLEAGPQRAQFVGDGQVAAGVAEADRRADVQRPLAAIPAPGPGPQPRCPRA